MMALLSTCALSAYAARLRTLHPSVHRNTFSFAARSDVDFKLFLFFASCCGGPTVGGSRAAGRNKNDSRVHVVVEKISRFSGIAICLRCVRPSLSNPYH